MSVLVIAEKPSVGMSIAAVLGARERKDVCTEGNGYIVLWCVGHLVGLDAAYEYDERYGKWRREDLPIVPADWKYVIFDAKKKQFNILRSLMNRANVENLVRATDSGREGNIYPHYPSFR
jgi:DNA topoisomerase-3